MAVKFFKKKLSINNKEKTVVLANYKADKESKTIGERHHVLIYDRSGSMSRSLSLLIDNMKKVVENIPENDYITILWFSSEGQCGIVVNGVKKGANDNDIYEKLEISNHTVGATCFSEVLKIAGNIIEGFSDVCSNCIVSLFTDGEAVVSRPSSEEYKLAIEEVSKYSDKLLAFNTIGYGYYYNEEFLKGLASLSEYGIMCHSSHIDEYYGILTDNFDRIKDLSRESLSASHNGKIMYLGGRNAKLVDKQLSLSAIDKANNKVMFISEEDDFEFELNGEKYNSKDIKSDIPSRTLIPLMYAFAYASYYNGDRATALDVLASVLMDKHLVDSQLQSFTYEECDKHAKELYKAIYKTKARLSEGECKVGYIPADNATCLIDVFGLLINGNSKYVYTDKYNHIGLRTVDNKDNFIKDKETPVTDIRDVTFNSKRMNVSIQSTIKGTVKLKASDARELNLDKVVNTCIFRNQAIVQDGNLNIEVIKVLVDNDTLKKLEKLGIEGLVSTIKDKKFDKYVGYNLVKLDLTTIPVINRSYQDTIGTAENVLENAINTNKYAVKQKVIKYLLSQAKDSEYDGNQLDLLSDYGLNSRLEYVGDVETVPSEDFYETREIEFQLKGSTTIPKIADIMDKQQGGKPLKNNGLLVYTTLKELEDKFNKTKKKEGKKATSKSVVAGLSKKLQNEKVDKVDIMNCKVAEVKGLREFLEEELKDTQTEKLALSIEQSAIKMAKVLTGSWFEGLTEDGKGGYMYSDKGNTVIIKTKRVKVNY